ncbi:uncharacterized protein BHQ10_009447 [Talaromyces amestolkiae]|uniref:Uncharacterized protein n=1 Tax=Talaromyces amestolkiae TaxID=1196081 RepID=A0A364LC79_TALAM|nr:uncharacterized protein BHQ10_009447 [Talaromyces amestolkiae]RAO73435.1 hypothetical protein BHQ10_009447 [Talaromyces amestolkiae]
MELPKYEVKSSALSIDSGSTVYSIDSKITANSIEETDPAYYFYSSRVLLISAQGIGLFRFPSPYKELEIPIYNSNGSIAYISRRESRHSGNAILSDPEVGDLIHSEYFFGPGRDPIISILETGGKSEPSRTKISSKWFSRTTTFLTPDGHELEWSYGKRIDSHNQSENLIILRLKSSSLEKHGKILSQLVRSDQTRTPGSSKSRAGNGGQLLIDESASKFVEEPLIVATCLLMLKKEIDRRRTVQIAMMSAMIGAGANS